MSNLNLVEAAPYSGERVKPFVGEKRYLSTGGLTDEGLNFQNITFENKPSRADIQVKKGDILFAKMISTNKALLIDESLEDIIVSTGFSVHRPKTNIIYPEFLLQYLRTEEFQRQKNKLSTGAIQSAITNKGIEKLHVPYLSIMDQIRIAKVLNHSESIVIKREATIAILEELIKSIFVKLFGNIEKNEKEYAILNLEDLCLDIVDCPHSTPKYSESITDYACIRTPELAGGSINWDSMKYVNKNEYDKRTIRLVPIEGDVVYGREGSYGEAVILPSKPKFCLGQRTMLMRPNSNVTNSIFLWALLNSDYVYRQATKKNYGATVGHVNVKDIKKFKVLRPEIELQKQFADIIISINKLKSLSNKSLKWLENLHCSLSQRIFKTELDLSKIDVNEDLKMHEELISELEHELEPNVNTDIQNSSSPYSILKATILNHFKEKEFAFEDIFNKMKENLVEDTFDYEAVKNMIYKALRNESDIKLKQIFNPEQKRLMLSVNK